MPFSVLFGRVRLCAPAVALFVLCLVPLFVSGCGGARTLTYPNFIRQKPQLGDITILSDMMIIQAIRGDTELIDLTENKDIGVSELQFCTDELRAKGYQVRNSDLTSVGLMVDPYKIYKMIRTLDDAHLPEDALPLGYAPFYLDPLVVRDTLMQSALTQLYSSIVYSGQKEDTMKTIIPIAKVVGARLRAKTLLVLLTGGFNVPITKGVTEMTANPDKAQNAIAVRPRSQLSVLMYILNATNGEIIWEDREYKNEGVVHKDRILGMLEDLLDEMP